MQQSNATENGRDIGEATATKTEDRKLLEKRAGHKSAAPQYQSPSLSKSHLWLGAAIRNDASCPRSPF